MTEEKLVERVTALFADSDAAQRKMIRLYAETNDAIEASAIIDSGAEVFAYATRRPAAGSSGAGFGFE